MRHYGLKDRLRYRFDEFMARGTPALIAGLAVFSVIVIFLGGVLVVGLSITDGEGNSISFAEALWSSLMRTLDAGTMGGDTGWGFRFVMFIVTVGGVFIISALIGILNNALETKLDELRKGRSPVVERDHTVILGWSGEVFSIIEQLVEANLNRRRPCITILSERDKLEMEEDLAARIADRRNTKIVCRTGSPIDIDDVGIVNIAQARSVIILPEGENADSAVIKTLLAVSKSGFRADGSQAVVARLAGREYLLPAKIASANRVTAVLVDEIIPRVVAQTCRQAGLSNVYVELLDFEGSEIYFSDASGLEGKTYRDAISGYDTSAIIGLIDSAGVPRVNPPMDTRIGKGWKVIAVSEDDDTVIPDRSPHAVREDLIVKEPVPRLEIPERFVIIGWNRRVPSIIRELDNYVAKGSEILVLGSNLDAARSISAEVASLDKITVKYIQGDTTDRETLESIGLDASDHVIVMCDDVDYPPEEADSRTLVTLIHVRDIAMKHSLAFSLTSQILDIRNRALAEVAEADDFIVSDRILSLMVAQLSENPELEPVLGDLFDAEGSEVYIKPSSDYVFPGARMDFYTVAVACAARGHTAIGYRKIADARNADKAYGIVVNPRKSETVSFSEGDGIIVIAED
ncbi:MAG: NAD-binding protein [Spirochaetes bacterium]|nr:NAD-binding protein [Spirochaetota bacterium]